MNGPLAITIWADSNPMIQFYKGGIYSHPDSPLAAEDHAITLVGWGEEKLVNGTPVPFWIIINSWGNTWWVGVCVHNRTRHGASLRRTMNQRDNRALSAGARLASCA